MKNKQLIVAELGINHNGDLNNVFRMIDDCNNLGIDYVKFQKRLINAVYTKHELDAPRQSPFGEKNRDLKEGLELSLGQYQAIDDYCEKVGMKWFVSCWDRNSLQDMQKSFKTDYIKIASALLTNDAFIKSVNNYATPVILSAGMSTLAEISHAALRINNLKYVLHTTSSYPTPVAELNLAKMELLKGMCDDVGYSNHYPSAEACLWALTNRAAMIEFHYTLDRAMYGSDQLASLNYESASNICKYRDFLENINLAIDIGVQPSEVPVKAKLRKI